MSDRKGRQAQRTWGEQPHDFEAARTYVRHLIQRGPEAIASLVELLAGRQLDIRHMLMNHSADSYGFWGLVSGMGFKITVLRYFGHLEGWAIVKHWGDLPFIDDGSCGPNPPHTTQILVSGPRHPHPYWRPHDNIADYESEEDYEDVHDAIRDALDICDGRVTPEDCCED